MFITFDEIKTGQTAAPAKYDSQGLLIPNSATVPPIPQTEHVTSYKDNPDGTTTNTLNDGSTSTVKYTKNSDGSLQPTEVSSTPVPNPTQAALYAPAAGYTGNSVADFLTAAQQPSDFTSRAKLATQYGIGNYTGTAAQNTQLLGILKAHATGNVSSLGIPNNISDIMGGPGNPTPDTPIDASSLSTTNGVDLNSVLKASVANGTIDSTTAGLLALNGASTSADQNYQDILKQLGDAQASLGTEGADLNTALNANGVSDSTKQLQQLNLTLAQQQGEIQSFDAETQAGLAKLDDQPIGQGPINNNKTAYQKQRDLTKLSMTASLAANVALAQAYQGNIDLGTKLAQQSVDLKYKPVEAEITSLQTQLAGAGNIMQAQDGKITSVINSLLTIRSTEIATQKDQQKQIQTLAIEAATNGAPLSVVNAMQSSSDPVQAASLGGNWIKGNLEKVGGTGTDTPVDKGVQFTQDDVQRLAASGLSTTDIKNIQADINAHGLDAVLPGLPANQQTAVKNILKGITPSQEGDTTQFLDADYLKGLYTDEELQTAAKAAGYVTKSGLFNLKATVDVDGYIQHLTSLVNQYRKAGYTDKDILKLLQ